MTRLISTRGLAPVTDFRGALMSGLARDGGLFTPERWPVLARTGIKSLAGHPYNDVAEHVLAPLVAGAFSRDELRGMIERAYAPFRHAATCPLIEIDTHLFVLELFRGPTLAFKDFAMRLLAEMLSHELSRTGREATIVCATSGDTGSAAIDAFADKANIRLFALYPHGRVSEVQRRQMTTVNAPNVGAIAIEGTFDDCQTLVKAMFAHEAFRDAVNLTAVNSINWARIAAQVVYYVHAGLALGAPDRAISFAVPTGNFGDIYAGYVAMQMGLRVDRLIIATNANDILARTLATGDYEPRGVMPTSAPSMDIQVSSNFERLMFHASGQDSDFVRRAFGSLKQQGVFHLPDHVLSRIREDFDAEASGEEEIASEIRRVWQRSGYLVDPHTATATRAARHRLAQNPGTPVVALATADPAKFPDAVEKACGQRPRLPEHLADLLSRPEKEIRLKNNQAELEAHILATSGFASGRA